MSDPAPIELSSARKGHTRARLVVVVTAAVVLAGIGIDFSLTGGEDREALAPETSATTLPETAPSTTAAATVTTEAATTSTAAVTTAPTLPPITLPPAPPPPKPGVTVRISGPADIPECAAISNGRPCYWVTANLAGLPAQTVTFWSGRGDGNDSGYATRWDVTAKASTWISAASAPGAVMYVTLQPSGLESNRVAVPVVP